MNERERVMTTVGHTQPDRTPAYCGRIDDPEYWLTSFSVADEEELRSCFQLDIRKTDYKGVFSVEDGKTIWHTSDQWDSGYSTQRGGFPLAGIDTVQQVEAHPWPKPQNVAYAELRRRLDCMNRAYATILSLGWQPPFCTLLDLFGMEEAMLYMHQDPLFIETAIAHIEAFLIDEMRQVMQLCAGDVQFYWCGDDFSTQRGMMISPEHWRRFLKPLYRKMFDLIKSFGLKVWFHSCGTFRPVLPDLVDMGMDVWETVQVHLEGNDPEELKREFGSSITFFGAVNCQKTLPFGSPQDVREEVRKLIKILGKGGGYVCGPDHSIQRNMPAANILALYDEIRACGQ